MDNNEIMVSVCCLVYNHEKYLRQCLDGFMMQKTDFKFEVLIHDDASTDGSADIIREYEEKYPDIIKPIYQTENQFSKGVKINWVFQYPRAQGKYLAFCEGDDFWTDEYKLQKQFDALEAHDEAVFCAHDVRKVDESGYCTINDEHIRLTRRIYSSSEWIKMMFSSPYYIHTSSYFFRRSFVLKWINNLPDFLVVSAVGDRPFKLLAATEGSLYFINEEMSCYRQNSINSWTTRAGRDNRFADYSNQKTIESFLLFDKFTNYQYSKDIHYAVLKFEVMILERNRKYFSLLSCRYYPIWKQYTIKGRLYIILRAFCAPIRKYFEKREKRSP